MDLPFLLRCSFNRILFHLYRIGWPSWLTRRTGAGDGGVGGRERPDAACYLLPSVWPRALSLRPHVGAVWWWGGTCICLEAQGCSSLIWEPLFRDLVFFPAHVLLPLFISDDLSGSGFIAGTAPGRWALSRCFTCFIIDERHCRYEAAYGTRSIWSWQNTGSDCSKWCPAVISWLSVSIVSH